jgi:hypothetical protein
MHLQVRTFLGLVCLLLSCVFAATTHWFFEAEDGVALGLYIS